MTRPRCPYCGKPLQRLTTYYSVQSPSVAAAPHWKPDFIADVETKSDAQALVPVPERVVSLTTSYDGKTVYGFKTWDGVTYSKGWNSSGFCRQLCAARFGIVAQQKGFDPRAEA
jgi:hypothetical protein